MNKKDDGFKSLREASKEILFGKVIKEAKEEKKYVIIKHRNGHDDKETEPMTIPELLKYFSYTLEVGASWDKKINRSPKNISSLIQNLNRSETAAAKDGNSSKSYSLKEKTIKEARTEHGLSQIFANRDFGIETDEVGHFFVVYKPAMGDSFEDSVLEDIVQEYDFGGLLHVYMGHKDEANKFMIHGVYKDAKIAKEEAEKVLKEYK